MNPHIIAIGASTGGIVALEALISKLPAALPPIVIVQHILPTFNRRFAERLDATGDIRVTEAEHGQRLQNGHAYLAPAHAHLLVRSVRGELRASLSAAPPVRFHRPSVDVLFHSLAAMPEVGVVAVLLTGMGRDGADGMLALRGRGAHTLVQDEASSAIFGMPKEAIRLGAAEQVTPLDRLPAAIIGCLRSQGACRA